MTKYLNPGIGTFAAMWGVAGACSVLLFAIFRMVGHVLEGFSQPLHWQHYAVMIPWLAFMLYSEGYRGFQKGYSPRVAARANYLRENSTPLRVIFAPLFCMGFFDSTRKRKIVIWILVFAITALVVLFQYIPQPWRGVLDLGVVLGLSWGIVATLVYFFKFWLGEDSGDPELPQSA